MSNTESIIRFTIALLVSWALLRYILGSSVRRYREKTSHINSRNREQVRLVIADSNPTFRDGLRRLLEAQAGFRVVGQTSDGFEAVKMARELKPDVLLLDLDLPVHSGFEILRELSTPLNTSPVRVILLTAAVERSQIVEALQVGARGVVLKNSPTRLLFETIQAVMAGEYWAGRERVSNLVQYLRTLMRSTHARARQQKKAGLTPRELEIVSAVLAGYSNKEIAEYFRISGSTVAHHLANIFEKFGVSTRLGLARWVVDKNNPRDENDGDEAGAAVRKPRSPNLNSGSAKASIDEVRPPVNLLGQHWIEGKSPHGQCHRRCA